MKRFTVYGVDLTKVLKDFDTFEDARDFARKGLRKWGKMVKDTTTREWIYKAFKNNNDVVCERYF